MSIGPPIVTQAHIADGLRDVGLREGDVAFFHSSLSSFGYVVNGADAVIDAFLSVVGPTGTVVVPTFVFADRVGEFGTWWDPVNSESDVGRITNVFRRRPNARRSDHPIHSVSAIGQRADEITRVHRHGGDRLGPWEGSFSVGSPFDRLLELNAKYLLVGVSFGVQTLCHLAETLIVERALARARDVDPKLHGELRAGVRQVWRGPGIWPGFDRVRMGERFVALNAWDRVIVGSATIYLAAFQSYLGTILEILESEPEAWFGVDFLAWYARVPGVSLTVPRTSAEAYLAVDASAQPMSPPGSMVRIASGWFVRGSPGDEVDAGTDESPQRLIYVDEFYLDRHPVTNADYARFVRATDHRPPPHWRTGRIPAGQASHPVIDVDWNDACAYAAWAGKRLPTEAEWEKAARGGVLLDGKPAENPWPGRRFPWGDGFERRLCATSESAIEGNVAVGAYSPHGDSPYGIADLAGNVWEWVSDWYDPGYYGDAPDHNPLGPAMGTMKVLRGGAAGVRAKYARCACRTALQPDRAFSTNGFRCAWSP